MVRDIVVLILTTRTFFSSLNGHRKLGLHASVLAFYSCCSVAAAAENHTACDLLLGGHFNVIATTACNYMQTAMRRKGANVTSLVNQGKF